MCIYCIFEQKLEFQYGALWPGSECWACFIIGYQLCFLMMPAQSLACKRQDNNWFKKTPFGRLQPGPPPPPSAMKTPLIWFNAWLLCGACCYANADYNRSTINHSVAMVYSSLTVLSTHMVCLVKHYLKRLFEDFTNSLYLKCHTKYEERSGHN